MRHKRTKTWEGKNVGKGRPEKEVANCCFYCCCCWRWSVCVWEGGWTQAQSQALLVGCWLTAVTAAAGDSQVPGGQQCGWRPPGPTGESAVRNGRRGEASTCTRAFPPRLTVKQSKFCFSLQNCLKEETSKGVSIQPRNLGSCYSRMSPARGEKLQFFLCCFPCKFFDVPILPASERPQNGKPCGLPVSLLYFLSCGLPCG
ncbi:hypothetical protein B0J18DRAFT_185334 [Chaetomium sp. MPI-SDFR-AT-0129]|nr:hypothetical protein B0J18DRAFT_185334 [Chaetomium sp. MPI-SDFR-AT-0129]